MGNTCSSVHIALTATTPDAIDGIVRAYTTLGFERTKTAPPEGGKHLILLRKDDDAFLSVYDSNNADLDTGKTERPRAGGVEDLQVSGGVYHAASRRKRPS